MALYIYDVPFNVNKIKIKRPVTRLNFTCNMLAAQLLYNNYATMFMCK